MNDLLVQFAIAGLLVNRFVDFLRNAFDKGDRIPKAWWLLLAWAIGIGLAFLVCNVSAFAALGVDQGAGCTAVVLAGLGFGSVAGFWHEILSALSSRTEAATPKGMLPRSE